MQAHQIAQIAKHLKVAEEVAIQVEEWAFVYWVKVEGKRPTFVSKKILSATPKYIAVETVKDRVVVVPSDPSRAYAIRQGFDLGDFYLVKRFDPRGKDIRFLDYSRVSGVKLVERPQDPRTAEYELVIMALRSPARLEAHGYV